MLDVWPGIAELASMRFRNENEFLGGGWVALLHRNLCSTCEVGVWKLLRVRLRFWRRSKIVLFIMLWILKDVVSLLDVVAEPLQ